MAFTAGQKLRASQMTVAVCTSSTRPAGHSGQMAYETDTGMMSIYTGTEWRYLIPTGEVGSDAVYNAASNQSIPNTTDTLIAFSTTVLSSPLVVRGVNGSGHYFRLQRAGRWSIQSTIRFSGTGANERYAAIRRAAAVVGSQGAVLGVSGSPVTHNISALIRVTPGTENTSAADIDVTAYQSSGGAVSLEHNLGNRWVSIALSWLGP